MDISPEDSIQFFLHAAGEHEKGCLLIFYMGLQNIILPVFVLPVMPVRQFFLIFHADQGQSSRRCRASCCLAVPSIQNFFHMFRRISPHSNLQQRTCNNTHHIIEKTASADANGDHVILLCDIKTVDGPHGLLRLGPYSAEALKIMLSHQICCCLSHFVKIQVKIAEMGIQTLQRHGNLPIQYLIFVGFDTVSLSGMPVRRDLFRTLHPNILRQTLV